ncbi:VOC family protein [Kineosporia corallincola]|uniref:VOC family protein n=1 Tax=Kineosporia corallincola TaxID=2835133 RepID=UPI0035573100
MSFASVRLITADVAATTAFYERVTGATAARHTDQFSEIRIGGLALAVAGTPTLALFGERVAEPAANRSLIVEFRVDDVDAEYERLRDGLDDVVQEPTTMPWGNRSLLFRDPEGNLVNLFTPVSAEARTRFGI